MELPELSPHTTLSINSMKKYHRTQSVLILLAGLAAEEERQGPGKCLINHNYLEQDQSMNILNLSLAVT